MKPELTARLQCVASYVREGDIVADIGTDHALLPIYLIKTEICRKVYASDIRSGPLETARKYLKYFGVYDGCIELIKSDGFLQIPNNYSTAVIAGMGGETISAILNRANMSTGRRYILQPMSKPERLRNYLYQNGFFIDDETIVQEQDRFYTIIVANPGQCLYEPVDIYASKKLRCKKDSVTKAYLNKILSVRQQVLQAKCGRVDPCVYKQEFEFHEYLLKKFSED